MLDKAMTSVRNAIMGVRRDLDGCRERIVALQAEREAVEIAALPADELRTRIIAEIDAAAARGAFTGYKLGLASVDGFQPWRLGEFINHSFAPLPNEKGARGAFDLFAAMFRDRLVELMTADLPTGGISLETKRKRLEEIDAKILATGVQEELLCREVDAATGTMIPRRGDADPAILLAPDAELRP